MTPSFSPTVLAWLEAGGVYALANIRGGGEYGKAWHDAGRLANKQNVFDDFIAAGEYLIAQGITAPRELAITAARTAACWSARCVNQRPDLFAAAHPAVGVMDMLRFDRFTAGRYWVDDYGYPNKEADFRTRWLIRPITTSRPGGLSADPRDHRRHRRPGRPRAQLQIYGRAAGRRPDGEPHLIRIETRAGHGSGKPTDKIIEENADVYAFLAKYTGLDPK